MYCAVRHTITTASAADYVVWSADVVQAASVRHACYVVCFVAMGKILLPPVVVIYFVYSIYIHVEDRVGDAHHISRFTHARQDTSAVRQCKISGRELSPLVVPALTRPRINSQLTFLKQFYRIAVGDYPAADSWGGTLGPHRVRLGLEVSLPKCIHDNVSARVGCKRRSTRELGTKTLRDDISAMTSAPGIG